MTQVLKPLDKGKATFSPFRLNNATAMDILIETITDRPELFTGRWFTVAELRDELIHEYDTLRLAQTYNQGGNDVETGHAITSALIHAVESAGWLERTGNPGVTMQWRVRTMPTVRPDDLAECHALLDQYKLAMRHWKDMGLVLQDSDAILRGMKLTVEDAADKLNEAVSLAVMFRNKALGYFNQLQEANLVKGEFRDPTRKELEKFMSDPKTEMQITDLKGIHSIIQ